MNHPTKSAWYEIRVRGQLSQRLLGAFPGLHAEIQGADTLLIGTLPDQAALHGVLARIEALCLELIELRRCGGEPASNRIRSERDV
ncbi:hypothetical protein ADL25_33655 [Streptomyces sp. NRRL F-5122]|uniref:hypothetical protein n=1 Tax=unclassified Streptomyces TaxID=2593676 RepID=UPI0007413521|nr:hypothetical protein [Streptomyces sp. NRRL F-5122]KUJ36285.1 hypothetical protein ADL25_33655 [Streptomyces sp. NRRL F-5122]